MGRSLLLCGIFVEVSVRIEKIEAFASGEGSIRRGDSFLTNSRQTLEIFEYM